jgi:hypothetical protein
MKLTTKATTLPLLVAAAFVGAGGFIHLREWLDTYRNVPASVPGADVVRIGFPVNAGLSAVIVVALVVAAFAASRAMIALVAVAAVVFQAGSLATLILSRTGSVLGWSEPIWSPAANQTRAVELGAIVALAGTLVLLAVAGGRTDRSSTATGDAGAGPHSARHPDLPPVNRQDLARS